jgi:hypothetical protein
VRADFFDGGGQKWRSYYSLFLSFANAPKNIRNVNKQPAVLIVNVYLHSRQKQSCR